MEHSRRGFLRMTAGASLAWCLPSGTLQAAQHRGGRHGENVLVVVQLTGGNDGLNTIVPFESAIYARSRPTLRLTVRDVLKLNDTLGMHPRMEPLWRLYQEGLVSVVQGVGYPQTHGGHGEAMRDWHTARPHDTTCHTGWLGRAADLAAAPGDPCVPLVFVGDIPTPLALNGVHAISPAIRSCADLVMRTEDDAGGNDRLHAAGAPDGGEGGLRDCVARALENGRAEARKAAEALRGTPRDRGYPPYGLAERLHTIARLIAVHAQFRVYVTELGGVEPGGFDTHANQAENHAALLDQFSASVAAFARDLAREGTLHRVLLVTFSEFGRTVAENGRRGTDHGAAAPVFLVGGALKGGLLGAHPDLTVLENGGPAHHTDFRSVFAAALAHALDVDPACVLGPGFAPLDVFAV